ncbi:MAG: PDZ domain-containing protein [Bacilli bacterium]|nr:PDZ domain-containing protein [Bacilli bacterium]
MKKFILSLLTIYLFIPISVFAYSDYIMASGQNIGIELKSDYVLVVGSYKIKNYNVLVDTDLKIGDKITKINNEKVTSIEEMQKIINEINEDEVEVTYIRGKKEYTEQITLYKENGEYKTGLYVRDMIRGVATLTFVDVANNNTFGALGHEIIEKSTKSKFDSKNGTIFSSTVTSITKSSNGDPGEKNARSDSSSIYGKVSENTSSGIFGTYTSSLPNSKLYKVATPNEIKQGKAKILTVITENKVEEFDINIIRINENSNSKNILFEVTDERLLEKTGGIVQGMSGSPIVQGENIIGAVNFVLVDSPEKGYGIFITNMLEEAEN